MSDVPAKMPQEDVETKSKLDLILSKFDRVFEDVTNLKDHINSDENKPLNIYIIEQTLVSKINEKSLIWAMGQKGIGEAFNNVYRLNSELMKSCKTMQDIFSNGKLVTLILNNAELFELCSLYPYDDFAQSVIDEYGFNYLVERGLHYSLCRIGNKFTLDMGAVHGSVPFVVVDKGAYHAGKLDIMVDKILDVSLYNTDIRAYKYSESAIKSVIEKYRDNLPAVIKSNLANVSKTYGNVYGGYTSIYETVTAYIYAYSAKELNIDHTSPNEHAPLSYFNVSDELKKQRLTKKSSAGATPWWTGSCYAGSNSNNNKICGVSGTGDYYKPVSTNSVGIVFGFTI